MSLSAENIVVFSDFHAHNFRYGSKRVTHDKAPGFYNSRLIDCISVLREIKEYCIKNNVGTVLFGGDLFHTRDVIHTDVFNLVFKEIESWYWSNITVVMIPGNHDQTNRTGEIHSLEPFKELRHVIVCDSVKSIPLWNKHKTRQIADLITIPYMSNINDIKNALKEASELAVTNKPRILLGHLGIQGAVVGSDYVLTNSSDVKVENIPSKYFDICLFGHYHQHQRLFENGWYIGATHHHNWGDANTQRGFLHLTINDDKTITFQQVHTHAPRFVKLNSFCSNLPQPYDFVEYEMTSWENPEEILTHLQYVESLVIKENVKDEEVRLTEDYLDAKAAIDAWVGAHGDSSSLLKDLGKSILAEAEDKVL